MITHKEGSHPTINHETNSQILEEMIPLLMLSK